MEYPTLLKRVQSTFVDQIIAFSLIGILITLANFINEDSNTLKVIAIIIGVSYEPLMMSFHRTVGQMMTGIRVNYYGDSGPLFLILYIRYIFKLGLGWVSLLTVTGHKKRQAIHDMISKTNVVFNTPIQEHAE